jgi:hypothetical protein
MNKIQLRSHLDKATFLLEDAVVEMQEAVQLLKNSDDTSYEKIDDMIATLQQVNLKIALKRNQT